MSARKIYVMETTQCPLCPEARELKVLEDHLAEHLESIALFVLPTEVDEGEEADKKENDKGSCNAAGGSPSSRQLESEPSDENDAGNISPGPVIPDLVAADGISTSENASAANTIIRRMEGREAPREQEPQLVGRTLFLWLKSHLLECPLGGQQFLPLEILDVAITKEGIQAELPWTGRFLQRGLSKKVVLQAKKVFAILVLIGEALAIAELVKEGLTDEDIPLFWPRGELDNFLVSTSGKVFHSFKAWKREAQVQNFLDKQWVVQAPVLDTTGKHFILDQKCALPFPKVEEVGGGRYSTVYKGTIHRAHQRGFAVSIASSQSVYYMLRRED
jgi:hypothetical protein